MQKDNERTIIHADPEIASLIPGYIENRRKDIIKLRAALDNGDYEAIYYIGHNMKGSGNGYGFREISIIGSLLEQAAKIRDEEEVRRGIDRLEEYINNIEVRYERG